MKRCSDSPRQRVYARPTQLLRKLSGIFLTYTALIYRALAFRVLAAVIALLLTSQAPATEAPAIERQQQLSYLLKHDCGSCHGMTLKGGLGPSLLSAPLKSKGHNIDSLSLIIRHGRPGTAMPPWGPILADEDIRWIAARLLESN